MEEPLWVGSVGQILMWREGPEEQVEGDKIKKRYREKWIVCIVNDIEQPEEDDLIFDLLLFTKPRKISEDIRVEDFTIELFIRKPTY